MLQPWNQQYSRCTENEVQEIQIDHPQSWSPKLFLITYLILLYKKLNKIWKFMCSCIFDQANCEACSCSGTRGVCYYQHPDINPNDYFHAVKNSYKNVPECSVEPFIYNGYMLPHQPWCYYLKVLWIPNNEAINVWTHLLPAVYFIWLFLEFIQNIDLLHAWPLLFINAGAISITMCSSIAHTFHSRSNYHHCCFFILDYFGISLFAFSSTTAHFFASAEVSYYTIFGWFNIIVHLAITAVGFYFCAFSQTRRKDSNTHHRQFKLWTNGLGYFYGILPLGHRMLTSSDEDPAITFYFCQMVCMTLGPILYATDFPQKYWPKKFDIFGHSHQIFHIFIAIGCYCDIRAVHIDLSSSRWKELNNQPDYPQIEVVTITIIVLSVYCILTALHFARKLRSNFQQELEGLWFEHFSATTSITSCEESCKDR